MKINSVRKLSEATGVTRSSLRRWSKKPWFPEKSKDGSWDAEAVLKAIDGNVRGRSKSSDREEAVFVGEVLDQTDAQAILKDTNSDPIDKARALLTIVSVAMSEASSKGSISNNDVNNMKSALEQLRQAEKAYLGIRVRKGELIERDVAKAIVFQLGKRFTSIIDVLKLSLGKWILDETEDQELREEFEDEFRRLSNEKLRFESAELEEMIVNEEERQGVKK